MIHFNKNTFLNNFMILCLIILLFCGLSFLGIGGPMDFLGILVVMTSVLALPGIVFGQKAVFILMALINLGLLCLLAWGLFGIRTLFKPSLNQAEKHMSAEESLSEN